MNYIALIGLCLGLFAILITIKYSENYNKLNRSLEKKCRPKRIKLPKVLANIRNKLNLTNKELIINIFRKKKKIIDLLKSDKESFN